MSFTKRFLEEVKRTTSNLQQKFVKDDEIFIANTNTLHWTVEFVDPETNQVVEAQYHAEYGFLKGEPTLIISYSTDAKQYETKRFATVMPKGIVEELLDAGWYKIEKKQKGKND